MKTLFFSYILAPILLFSQISPPVDIDFKVDEDFYYPGEVVKIITNVSVEPDFHIYAINKQSKGPIPSKVTINGDVVDFVGQTIEPEPINKYDEGFLTETFYHEGKFKFETTFKLLDDIDDSENLIITNLLFQACDPTLCYPPTNFSDTLLIDIREGNIRPEKINIVKSEQEKINFLADDQNIDLDTVISSGFWSFILLSISMGFLALLTPCVFPMIPITVSYFTKIGEDKKSKPFQQASIYSLGIIITYTFLGLLLAITLGGSGANQLASNPWVNLFIAGIFIYFSLSLFGMYEIQLPSRLRQFSVSQEGRGGVIGTLFMAFTFTLTSFTCTVQFIGLLLVRAIQGDWLWPFIGMLFFSAAFALPFFFLALFPQYLNKLPKSGGWLNSVKVSMGFLEVAAAFKFLSNSDLIWGWDIFTRSFVLASWVVIFFLCGVYLIGKIKLPHDSELKFISVPRLVISIILFSFSLYMARGLFGQPIHGLIESYLPPSKEKIASTDNIYNENNINWIYDFDEAIAVSEMTGKSMFVNFTGYTCTNCRWMETNILILPEIEVLLKEYVTVELYTDGGPNHKEYQKMEIERFGTAALPFYVIIDSNSNEIARFPGLTRDPLKFIEFLQKGINSNNELITER